MQSFKVFFETGNVPSQQGDPKSLAVAVLRDILQEPSPQREHSLRQKLLEYAFTTEFEFKDLGYTIRSAQKQQFLTDEQAEFLIDNLIEIESQMPRNWWLN